MTNIIRHKGLTSEVAFDADSGKLIASLSVELEISASAGPEIIDKVQQTINALADVIDLLGDGITLKSETRVVSKQENAMNLDGVILYADAMSKSHPLDESWQRNTRCNSQLVRVFMKAYYAYEKLIEISHQRDLTKEEMSHLKRCTDNHTWGELYLEELRVKDEIVEAATNALTKEEKLALEEEYILWHSTKLPQTLGGRPIMPFRDDMPQEYERFSELLWDGGNSFHYGRSDFDKRAAQEAWLKEMAGSGWTFNNDPERTQLNRYYGKKILVNKLGPCGLSEVEADERIRSEILAKVKK